MELLSPFYYTYFLFEIYTVLKEDNIKNVSGYSFFQLPFWAKIFYECNNKAVEICLNQKKISAVQLLIPKNLQERLKCAIAWMDEGGGRRKQNTKRKVFLNHPLLHP